MPVNMVLSKVELFKIVSSVHSNSFIYVISPKWRLYYLNWTLRKLLTSWNMSLSSK